MDAFNSFLMSWSSLSLESRGMSGEAEEASRSACLSLTLQTCPLPRDSAASARSPKPRGCRNGDPGSFSFVKEALGT